MSCLSGKSNVFYSTSPTPAQSSCSSSDNHPEQQCTVTLPALSPPLSPSTWALTARISETALVTPTRDLPTQDPLEEFNAHVTAHMAASGPACWPVPLETRLSLALGTLSLLPCCPLHPSLSLSIQPSGSVPRHICRTENRLQERRPSRGFRKGTGVTG